MRTLLLLVLCAACAPGPRSLDPDAAGSPRGDAGAGSGDACIDCLESCAAAALSRSSVGCEYWPADLPNALDYYYPQSSPGVCFANGLPLTAQTVQVCQSDMYGFTWGLCDANDDCSVVDGGVFGSFSCKSQDACVLDAQHSKYAIVVANPDAVHSVDVTLADAASHTVTVTLAPGEVHPLFPQDLGFPDHSIAFSGIDSNAYHLTSTRPIVAYQFNPLDNVGVFSNEASLLLPTSVLDTRYLAMTYPTWTNRPSGRDFSAYVTVVASSPGTTTVTASPTARVRPGTGVAAFGPGDTRTFTLSQFQTLTLEAMGNGVNPQSPGDDLTGTTISADQPVAVYSGHEAAGVSPNAALPPCCKDHLEEQMFPASTWGSHYLVAHTHDTGNYDLVRIVAQHPGTTIAISPAPAAGSCPALGAGEHCDLWIWLDSEITSNEPIMVGHFTLSYGGQGELGDPAMAIAIPVEQFRTDYSFLVPTDYDTNRLLVVSSGDVMLDGVLVADMTGIAGSAYRATRIPVTHGVHRIACPGRCGVEVVGWSPAVGYMFAAGVDLHQLVIE